MAGCSALTGVTVTGTTDGTTPVAAGTPITITLPAGFTFTGGEASPLVLTADANGQVTLPSITAPLNASGMSLTATSGAVSAAAPVTVTTPIGTRLYVGAISFNPDFIVVPETNLPTGYAFRSVHATDGAVFATLGDGSLWVARENPTTGTVPGPMAWYDTGLDADAGSMLASSSPNVYDSLVQVGGALYTVTVPGTWSTAPTTAALPNPASGAPVQLASINGVGTYYAETADGRVWSTPRTGASRGTWTEITGFQAPLKDWFVLRGNNSETVWVIDANGGLFSSASGTGIRPTVVANRRNAGATWVAPLSHFAKNHADSANGGTGGAAFVDANGNLFSSSGSQNVDRSGVLAGQLGDLQILRTDDSLGSTTNTILHVVTGGRLYAADLQNNYPFADITPPASQLGTATIVDAHSTGSGNSGFSFAIDSQSRVWVSNRYLNGTPVWTLAGGQPAMPNAGGIVQDGKFTYVFGEPSSCPV
ncbi:MULTISPECIES: hypothetical protein [unclassified Microbacterium]|uniref:hypothetical protein n=1 Tax=unclassified Microbacterium TaxID=2609290 RepID=UPI00109CEDCF|nr:MULTISPECIES: hypothetical protein [unclassified Microbacterium]